MICNFKTLYYLEVKKLDDKKASTTTEMAADIQAISTNKDKQK